MPTPHRLPISLRIPRPRHRRRPRERPTRRPPRLRHPHRFRIRYRSYPPREIAQTRRRPVRIIRIHVRAYPIDLRNQRRPITIGPYISSIDMSERPIDTSVLHSRARLADIAENRRRTRSPTRWIAIQILAANRDANDERIQSRILLHGRSQRIQLICHDSLAARTPYPEQQCRARVDSRLERRRGRVCGTVFDHRIQPGARETGRAGQRCRGGEFGCEIRACATCVGAIVEAFVHAAFAGGWGCGDGAGGSGGGSGGGWGCCCVCNGGWAVMVATSLRMG